MMKEITKLVLRIAKANPLWGYDKIQGAMENLGHQVSPSTIGNILKKHGIEPAPERGKRTSWRTFLKAHWGSITAADFFTTEVWTLSGLITYYTVFFIDLATRTVYFAGTAPNPNGMFIEQVARNLTDAIDGFLLEKRFLIIDRDKKFTEGFKHLVRQSGIDVVLCPAKAPNCNSYAERFVLSVKSECLNRMIFFGEASLRRAITEYGTHYHKERNHQGLGNRLIEPGELDRFPRASPGSLRLQLHAKLT